MQLAIPTGPFFTFTALPYPLPPEQQAQLRSMALDIKAARSRHQKTLTAHHDARNREAEEQRFDETKAAVDMADAALSAATCEMRKQIGVEVTRREFLLREQVLAEQDAERKFRAGLA